MDKYKLNKKTKMNRMHIMEVVSFYKCLLMLWLCICLVQQSQAETEQPFLSEDQGDYATIDVFFTKLSVFDELNP